MKCNDKIILEQIYTGMYHDTLDEGWKSKLLGLGAAAGLGAMGMNAINDTSPKDIDDYDYSSVENLENTTKDASALVELVQKFSDKKGYKGKASQEGPLIVLELPTGRTTFSVVKLVWDAKMVKAGLKGGNDLTKFIAANMD